MAQNMVLRHAFELQTSEWPIKFGGTSLYGAEIWRIHDKRVREVVDVTNMFLLLR